MHENNTSKKVSLNVKGMFQALPKGSQANAQALVDKNYAMKKSINIGALKAKGKK